MPSGVAAPMSKAYRLRRADANLLGGKIERATGSLRRAIARMLFLRSERSDVENVPTSASAGKYINESRA